MIVFVDTSVLIRFVSPDDPRHSSAAAAVATRLRAGDDLIFTPQSARETWAVLTLPVSVSGYELDVDSAQSAMDDIQQVFRFLDDVPGIYDAWRSLVMEGVSGKQVHDANHVAAMRVHGVRDVLTFDRRDFDRYEWLTVHTPSG